MIHPLAILAALFDRLARFEAAATICGIAATRLTRNWLLAPPMPTRPDAGEGRGRSVPSLDADRETPTVAFPEQSDKQYLDRPVPYGHEASGNVTRYSPFSAQARTMTTLASAEVDPDSRGAPVGSGSGGPTRRYIKTFG